MKIFPGLRLNLSRSGVSASVGIRRARVTYGPRGISTTVGLPGTGLSYTHHERRNTAKTAGGAGQMARLIQRGVLSSSREPLKGSISTRFILFCCGAFLLAFIVVIALVK